MIRAWVDELRSRVTLEELQLQRIRPGVRAACEAVRRMFERRDWRVAGIARDRLIEVRRGESETGRWELVKSPPGRGLGRFVRGYTGFVEVSAARLGRRETPSGTGVLVLNFGDPLEIGAPGRPAVAHAGSFVARMSELPATTGFCGISAGVQVDFSPLGLHLFCGAALDTLPDPAVDLDDVLGPEGPRLTEMLESAPGWEARFDLLDAAITRRFAGATLPTPSVEWAWNLLDACGGRVEIRRLVERIGCSPRHLIAGFREQVGVTPKTAARILRFERAARQVRVGGVASLASIAARCGYHDQAHMTREFRALAGLTPAAYRHAVLPGHVGVPDDVNSVQEDRAAPA